MCRAVRPGLFSGGKMKALKTVIEAGRMFDLEKIIDQRRAVGLADHRNVIKRTFLAVSKQTPPYEKRFV